MSLDDRTSVSGCELEAVLSQVLEIETQAIEACRAWGNPQGRSASAGH